MGTLRFADLQTRPMEVLDLTSLTVEEFQHILLPLRSGEPELRILFPG
jgi:hypothetical protein